MAAQTVGPQHLYTHKNLSRKIQLDLIGTIGSRGLVIETKREHPQGTPYSSFCIRDETGKELGTIEVESEVRYSGIGCSGDLLYPGIETDNPIVNDVLKLISNKYSDEKVMKLRGLLTLDYYELSDILQEEISALPIKKISEISGLHQYVSQLIEFIQKDRVLSLYFIVNNSEHTDHLMESCSFTKKEVDCIKRTVEGHLGEKVVELHKQLYG